MPNELLLQTNAYDTSIDNFNKKLKIQNEIIIWGCGNSGKLIYDYITELKCTDKITCFIDNNDKKWGKYFCEQLIISPSELIKKYKTNSSILIIIACIYVMEVYQQLLELGVESKDIDMKGLYIAKNRIANDEVRPCQYISEHIAEVDLVYSKLADKRSKEIYLGLLNSKISLDNTYMRGLASAYKSQYFDDELIKLVDDEVICDCGSYNGDTLEQFVKITEGKYKKYYAFEADEAIYQELLVHIQKKNYDNVIAHNIGCWKEKTVLKFHADKIAGCITEMGEKTIKCNTLDNLLKGQKISFIKMDIEGAEEMALQGATEIIKSNKPVLAICIYHKLEDYLKLPLIMKSFYNDYKIFIRHYLDMYSSETVCYAIPKNRLKEMT